MEEFIYETHLHTSEASACGTMTGREQVQLYKSFGYTGIIVTDHFFNGNCAIPRDLPWQERIHAFCTGYRNAKKEGDRVGLQVFFGLEANFRGQEFLLYGLNEEWLKQQEDMLSWSPAEQFKRVKAAGGLVVQAHPYRQAYYIPEVKLYPDCCEAFETANAANKKPTVDFNIPAREYAEEHHIPQTGGTDAHGLCQARGGMIFEKKWTSTQDFIDAVRSEKGYQIIRDFRER